MTEHQAFLLALVLALAEGLGEDDKRRVVQLLATQPTDTP